MMKSFVVFLMAGCLFQSFTFVASTFEVDYPENLDKETENPDNELENLEKEVENLEKEAENLEKEAENPENEAETTEIQFVNFRRKSLNPDADAVNPEYEIKAFPLGVIPLGAVPAKDSNQTAANTTDEPPLDAAQCKAAKENVTEEFVLNLANEDKEKLTPTCKIYKKISKRCQDTEMKEAMEAAYKYYCKLVVPLAPRLRTRYRNALSRG